MRDEDYNLMNNTSARPVPAAASYSLLYTLSEDTYYAM